MVIRYLGIKNFRGIKFANLTFPREQRVICMIGAGDSTKSTILTAISYALWSSWNLQVLSADFYNCNMNEPIEIELTIDEIPDELLKDSKYGMYLRGDIFSENDEPGDEILLTIKLTADDTLEPCWNVICNRADPKPIGQSDRQKLSYGFVGTGSLNNMNWGRGSVLNKYIDPRATIKKNIGILEEKANEVGEFSELDEIKEPITLVANTYGVSIDGKINNRLVFKSSNSLSAIEVYENDKPLNQRGLGSKKLLNLGLHVHNEQKSSLILVDEIEIGLEPYRQRNLIHELRRAVETTGQVIFTTHSPTVLVEMNVAQVLAVHSNEGITSFNVFESKNTTLNSKMQGNLRGYPEAFLSQKIIICEGATEIGFVRALDQYLVQKYNFFMASKGVSMIDGGGGAAALELAEKMHQLNYNICLLVDNDRPEDVKKKKELIDRGITLFQWQQDMCLEREIIPAFSTDIICKILNNISENRKDAVWNEITAKTNTTEKYVLNGDISSDEKKIIAQICTEEQAFKNVDGGERLGEIVFEHIQDLDKDSYPKSVLDRLIEWIE